MSRKLATTSSRRRTFHDRPASPEGLNQQVTDDVGIRVAQRGNGHDRREAAAVLADVGQFVDVFNAARGLEGQRLKARGDRRSQFKAERLGTGHHLLRIVYVAGVDAVDHLGGQVAQHAFRPHIEELDDPFFVRRDDREIGAGQDRVLQGARLEQCLLAVDLSDAVCGMRIVARSLGPPVPGLLSLSDTAITMSIS